MSYTSTITLKYSVEDWETMQAEERKTLETLEALSLSNKELRAENMKLKYEIAKHEISLSVSEPIEVKSFFSLLKSFL